LARPVELVRARAVLGLQAAEDLGLPCKRKKSQAGRGQAAGAARWDQGCRRGGKCFVHFSTFKTPAANCRPKAKPYAHSQLVIRLCCDFSNARTALLILPARTGYKPIGCIVRKRGNDIR
jgi:hypothetical protein